eukprot:TRINITY_DN96302_c0_g1_i1.p1 TRINITY_DN96302_c0_g1~~TRINITY_DN96302_c0_g1_i1.p1  ORF type:complete len:295 (-),score=44.52 TRINITY_DN96302_c0_g1_i1:373-1257(-)
MAYAPAIAPWLRLSWDGMDKEEKAHASHNFRLDLIMAPIFLVWYGVLATMAAPSHKAAQDALLSGTSSPWTWAAFLLRSALAALAVYFLLLHMLAQPAPQKNQEAFQAQKVFGRWIYLTRHGLALQACHQLISVLSLVWPWLAVVTSCITMVIGSLAAFVTIQFFLLVAPNAGYKAEVKEWDERGVQFGLLQDIIHIPALFIALADILLVQNFSIVRAALSLRTTAAILALYVFVYLMLIFFNFWTTRHWPYKLMNEFGTNHKKWLGFVCMQTGILYVFLALLWSAFMLRGLFN